MLIINNNTVKIDTFLELKNVLESDNNYTYIFLGNNILLESGISINENKEKIVIDGTYLGNKYTLTGMDSEVVDDTITVNIGNSEITVKNMNIIYTNIYGVVYVPQNKTYANIVVIYDNIKFNGTQLSFNPYGTTKITDSIITIEDTNSKTAQEVCESSRVIIGGNTTINSSSTTSPLFYFRNDTARPSIIFLCKSRINMTSDNEDFMNGTNKLNFTILHDTEVILTTANGFAAYSVCGANNVLIEERASLIFLENNHQRIPMWGIFGNFTMKEKSVLQLINSYDKTPSDNYNLHFKGSNCTLTLDNPKEVAIYTKNANVIYTDNELTFSIKGSRINLWNDSVSLTDAGGINDLPDYCWYKNDSLVEIEGTLTKTETTITRHNLTDEELIALGDISNFKFQSKKEFSIGRGKINVHPINDSKNTISGHTSAFSDVLIESDGINEVVTADSDGLFSYTLITSQATGTEVSITASILGSFLYETRKVTVPFDGELSLMDTTEMISFSLVPLSTNPVLFGKVSSFVNKVIDSRVNSSNWRLFAYINNPLTSANGFVLPNALVFLKFDNEKVILDDTPKLVYEGTDNMGSVNVDNVTWSKEKGPLLDLSDNALEVNEEYFADIYFDLEE